MQLSEGRTTVGSRKKHPGIRHHLSAPKCTIVGDVRSRSVYLAGLRPVFQSALPGELFVRLSGPLGSDLSYPLTFHPMTPKDHGTSGCDTYRATEVFSYGYAGRMHTRTCAGVGQDEPEPTPLNMYTQNPAPIPAFRHYLKVIRPHHGLWPRLGG